ncbi:MAG: GNAT family N-acetyltransferase [Atopobiaceae bacterium]|nr:GNAT family N-acetyltransferase [Atopobiaceae bacterium]
MVHLMTHDDLPTVVEMALLLWPSDEPEALEREFISVLDEDEATILVATDRDRLVGFALCRLRHDYVEGTTGSPVGYLEGIYVHEGDRRRHFASEMIGAFEKWARRMGCREVASDCEIGNVESEALHLACDFDEANRIICFVKRI